MVKAKDLRRRKAEYFRAVKSEQLRGPDCEDIRAVKAQDLEDNNKIPDA